MTARAQPIVPTSAEYEAVRGQFYIMEPDDFPQGCGIILEADSGKQWGVGRNKLGATVKLRLYHPLCGGCDEPIPDSRICENCKLVHMEIGS